MVSTMGTRTTVVFASMLWTAAAFVGRAPIQPRICSTISRPVKRSLLLAPTSTQVEQDDKKFDELLSDPMSFGDAVKYYKQHPEIELSRDRFNKIFDAIEERTSAAEEHSINVRMEQELPMLSESRIEMTEMYDELKAQGHLRLFGSVNKDNMPASGSHAVRPAMLEEITSLSMKSLTPKPSNTLLYAGVAVAVLEALASGFLGLDLNLLFFLTVSAVLADRLLLNGGVAETLVKFLSPETQPKITRHEAGHFLCAYILGCPVEGYTLSAWSAMKDSRFASRGINAGTSFFDLQLSQQIGSGKLKLSSIDRYSIIVMAGIAAEAVIYGRADGGAGDELALISFLSNLNGYSTSNPVWNDLTIRNQARWGALQAVLIIREYKECYDALVDAMERGGTLGDCIYAIENAGRENNKDPLKKPLGYIVEQGKEEVWVTDLPEDTTVNQASDNGSPPIKAEPTNPDETLNELRNMVTSRIKDLDTKLGAMGDEK